MQETEGGRQIKHKRAPSKSRVSKCLKGVSVNDEIKMRESETIRESKQEKRVEEINCPIFLNLNRKEEGRKQERTN